jgi:hypothetical protein
MENGPMVVAIQQTLQKAFRRHATGVKKITFRLPWQMVIMGCLGQQSLPETGVRTPFKFFSMACLLESQIVFANTQP